MLLQRWWDAVKDIGGILWPARFSIGVAIIAVPFLWLLGPSQDALLAAVGQHHSVGSKVLLAVACLLWALETFYWAQFMTRLPRPPIGVRACPDLQLLAEESLEAFNERFPFWLGLIALLIAAGATAKANWGSGQALGLIAAALVVDIVLYVVLVSRFGATRLTPIVRRPMIMSLLGATTSHVPERAVGTGQTRHRDLFQGPHRNLFQGQRPRASQWQIPDLLQTPSGPQFLVQPSPDLAPPAASRPLPCRWTLVVMVLSTAAVCWWFTGSPVATRQWVATGMSLLWLVVGASCLLKLSNDDMPPVTKFWVLLNFVLFTAIFIASLVAAPFLNGGFPDLISSPLVMLSAFSAWVFFGTFFLALPAELFRLPVTSLVLAVAIVLGFIPDNHDIRRLDEKQQTSVKLEDAFRDWSTAAAKEWKGQGRIPLVIVATAGGASRAGYWTAKVLGELEDSYPGFHHYVFAISSVSGGTVGAGLWRTMLERPRCVRGGSYVGCARVFFCQDFLGPMFMTGLYADLTQRVLPGGLLPDRANALEQSWEVSWANTMSDPKSGTPPPAAENLMSAPFHAVKTSAGDWRPHLLINGTSEKSGRRIITSQLQIADAAFPDAIDFFAKVSGELRFSTALHNSARFTYLDAAGNLVIGAQGDGVRNDRILDGGYYENFGADTAFDLLRALRALPGFDESKIEPIMVQISSNPELETDDLRDPDWTNRLDWSDLTVSAAPDTLAPITTLFSTRDAHGIRATRLSQNGVSAKGRYVHFRLTNKDIPMSWAMSGAILKFIDEEWDEPSAKLPQNRQAQASLAQVFGALPAGNTSSPTPDPPCKGLE